MNIPFKGGVLRPFTLDDVPTVAKHANDRDVWINLRDRFPHPYEEEHATAYISWLATLPRQLTWAIDVNGEAVGSISLMPLEDVERTSTEVGYWLGRSQWGKGIATKAVRALTSHALGGGEFTRVFALPFASNAASIRVLEKAGFVREGAMRRSCIKDGRILDQYMYGAYDDTWREHP
jgi:RimJ/RimL family protein N-acetyltransferase